MKDRQYNDQKDKKRTRKALIYLRCNQKPYIEVGQTIQWPKEKNNMINNDLQNNTRKTKDRATWTLLITRDELMCSGRISISCSTGGTRLVTTSDKSWMRKGPDSDCDIQEDPWSFMTRIFSNGKPSHVGDFNLRTMNPWFCSFLVSSNLLSSKLWSEPQTLAYRINGERSTHIIGDAGMLLHINEKFRMEKLKSFVAKFRS